VNKTNFKLGSMSSLDMTVEHWGSPMNRGSLVQAAHHIARIEPMSNMPSRFGKVVHNDSSNVSLSLRNSNLQYDLASPGLRLNDYLRRGSR